jgi:hypothetical protein
MHKAFGISYPVTLTLSHEGGEIFASEPVVCRVQYSLHLLVSPSPGLFVTNV